MLTRRDFTMSAAAGVGLAACGPGARAQAGPGDVLAMDAMGEIRDSYTNALIGEMLEAGMNSVTVTLCDPKSFEAEAFDLAMAGIAEYDALIADQSGFYLKAVRMADVERARAENKIALFYLFQNSTQFGRDLASIDHFYGLGVRSSQLTYNWQNWAGSGCYEEAGSGLTRFGHELVEKMNSAGMLIDLSHAGMPTMADAIAASAAPIIISHTCCKALYEHPRNTTDANMRAAADKGGLVGVTQMRPFMTRQIENAVHVYYEHIEHAVSVAGEDHVCIGSDRDHRRLTLTEEYLAELKAEEGENFDRAMWPLYFEELNGPRRMETIWNGLAARGMGTATLEKIFGRNLARLYGEVVG